MTNSRTTPFSLVRSYSSSFSNSSGIQQESSSYASSHIGNSTFSGSDNPRYKDQIRLGQDATTSYSGTLYSGESVYFSMDLYGAYVYHSSPTSVTWQSASCQGYLNPGIFPAVGSVPSSVVTDVRNRCIRKFVQEVNSAQTNGNLTGRSIKHFEHDLHSVFNPLSAVRGKISEYLEHITNISSRYKRGSPYLLNAIRESYLELQFGLIPFSDDMRAICSDLSRRRLPEQRVSSVATERYQGTNSRYVLNGSDFGYVSNFGLKTQIFLPYLSVSEYSLKYIGAVRTKVNPDSGKVSWLQDNNLLPKDWIPTLYHILPYSWMVDYFTNLGDIVDSLSFVFSDLIWACSVTRNQSSVVIDASSIGITWTATPSGAVYINQDADFSGGRSTWLSKTISRGKLTPSDLVPSFVFRIPTKPEQYVNMLAAFLPRISKIVSLLT